VTDPFDTVREALDWALDRHDYGGTENPQAHVTDALTALASIEERLKAAEEAMHIALDRVDALTAALRVIPPDKLEALAAWLDLQDAHDRRNGDEVQRDLRRMASLARAALASGKDKP
jgi:hypothetical protein